MIGRPLLVDFAWILDTHHGADYFRRWHREKDKSGGLLVHKATHHFDLVNWWIDSYPSQVFAYGDLLFYGKDNAQSRGKQYPYTRYTGIPEAQGDPFALFLDQDPNLRGLYLDAEAETGYLRDRNVFGEPVTIEDTAVISARYRSGALLSYCLVAYSPWEGMTVSITGAKGRAELKVVESVEVGQGKPSPLGLSHSTGPFKESSLWVFPQFHPPYEYEIPVTEGGHGGADPALLEQLFAPNPPPDPLGRAAGHIDGAASILLGIAANHSLASGQAIRIDDLLKLPQKA